MDLTTVVVLVVAILVAGMTLDSIFGKPSSVKSDPTKLEILNKELIRLHHIIDTTLSVEETLWAQDRITKLHAEILKMTETKQEPVRDYNT